MGMADVLPFDLKPATALKIIREVALDSSRVFFSKHVKTRMKRRKITNTQIFRVLKRGQIIEGPAPAIKGNWEFTMCAYSAGKNITLVGALGTDNNGNRIIIITVYR